MFPSRQNALIARRAAQIIACRQHMGAHDVQEFFDIDILVMRSHAIWVWAIDIGRDAVMPPKPRIGATEADDGRRARAAERLDVVLKDTDHLVMWVAP